jgi:gas vesicle protein
MKTMLAAACLVALSTLGTTSVPAADSVTEKAADIKDTTKDKAMEAKDTVKDRAVRTKERLADKTSDVVDTLKEKVTEAKDKAVETKNRIKDRIASKFHRREPGSASAPTTDVREAQQALKDRGYDPGPIDGKAGPKTHAALADFQRVQGLDVNGTLDSATAARLKEKAATPSPRPGERSAPESP